MAVVADDSKDTGASSRKRLTGTRVAYRVVSTLTMLFVIVAAALAIAYIMGLRFYVVMSGSMAPTMPTGSLCVVYESYPYDNVEAGDIVAFRTETGIITTHRVSTVTSRGLITKGDANEDADAVPVTKMGYAGRALWLAPGLGNMVELLLSPVGIGVIVAAVVALLVAELALKRAADVEDAADAALGHRDVDVDTMNAIVASAAEKAVRATMREYLIYDDVFDVASDEWSRDATTAVPAASKAASRASAVQGRQATSQTSRPSATPLAQAAYDRGVTLERRAASATKATGEAQFVPTLQETFSSQE